MAWAAWCSVLCDAILEQPMGCAVSIAAEDIGAKSDATSATIVEMDQNRRMVNREYTFTFFRKATGFFL